MLGFMHLTQAQRAARDKQNDDALAHLNEAGEIAARIGERNGMRMHFGPTNCGGWRWVSNSVKAAGPTKKPPVHR
jgi:predicted Zn-ribbon and HTH transcriptional regulator